MKGVSVGLEPSAAATYDVRLTGPACKNPGAAYCPKGIGSGAP